MFNIIKRLLFNPRKGFEDVYLITISKANLLFYILLPLSFISSIISVIRLNLIGIKYNSIHTRLSLEVSIVYGILELILLISGTYLSIILINSLIKSFRFLYPSDYTYRLVMFSIIPAFIGELFFLYPKFSSLSILLQLYSFYMLYQGLKCFYKGMGDKTTTVFLLIILILLFIFTIVFGILNTIIVNVLKV